MFSRFAVAYYDGASDTDEYFLFFKTVVEYLLSTNNNTTGSSGQKYAYIPVVLTLDKVDNHFMAYTLLAAIYYYRELVHRFKSTTGINRI